MDSRSLHRSALALLVGASVWLSSTAGAQAVRRGLPGQPQRDTAAAQKPVGTIDGFVGDTALNPLLSAEVKLLSTNVGVKTGPNGRFRISQVPAGRYVVIVRRAGYSPTSAVIDVPPSDTLRLAYELQRSATSLAPAVITAAATSRRNIEFEQRRSAGFGEFMTEADIKKRNSVYTTELLRRFRTVNVSPSSTNYHGGMPDYYALSRRETGSLNEAQQNYCPMTVFVDNIAMPTPFNLDLLPLPRNLMGIEVYNGAATMPPQFSGMNRGCGVILVWTKDGA
jgi:hypothetical protein